MKRIIIGLVILVLAITIISIGLIHSQNQVQAPPPTVLPKDLGKLEYKFNKDEVVVYKMIEDITVSSEHEYYKNAGGHATQEWYFVIKNEDIVENQYKFLIYTFAERAGEHMTLTRDNFILSQNGTLTPILPEYWLFLDQPRFQDGLKEQWESTITMLFGADNTKDPSLNVKAKYSIKGVEKVSDIDCLVIEGETYVNDYINKDGRKNLIEIHDKSLTYFAYKLGRVMKMDIDRHFKVTLFGEEDGKEINIVMRDEKATTKYELSDRKFTQTQLDAWLYDKYPNIE